MARFVNRIGFYFEKDKRDLIAKGEVKEASPGFHVCGYVVSVESRISKTGKPYKNVVFIFFFF